MFYVTMFCYMHSTTKTLKWCNFNFETAKLIYNFEIVPI